MNRFHLCAAAAFILTFAAASRGEKAKGLSIASLMEMRSVSDPRVSPDGAQVAYVLQWPDPMTDVWYTNLWLSTVDGSDNRPLTHGQFRDRSPRWSPDGSKLAFLSNREGRTQLFIRWMDSGEIAPVTNLIYPPADIAWSPDGTRLAYTALVPSKPAAPVRLPPKPPGAKWAPPPRVIDRMVYRQDRIGYLPDGYRHVFVVPESGGPGRQITTGDFNHSAPQWSPDGNTIFTTARTGDVAPGAVRPDIYAVSVADGSLTRLTTNPGPEAEPRISPDGSLVAYTGFEDKGYSYTVTNLYVMNATGTNPRMLTAGLDRDVRDPQWAADGDELYFLSNDRGAQNLFRVSLEGEVREITQGPVYLTSYSVAANGAAAAVATSPNAPPDIVSFSANDPNTTALTAVNQNVLADVSLGEVEEVWYKAPDGRDVQGWIVKPPDFDSKRKYPLILYIHGGPHAMFGVRFRHDFQVLAASGYVVLYTNPRGSTGYGQEWGNLIQFDYPGEANFSDLMSGVDAVIARGYVDAARLGVTGGSGGGLMTAWAVTHTNRFAAAAAQYPSINWFSLALTTDRAAALHGRRFKKWPWEDPEEYLRVSPIRYVGEARTPTMILTGEEDWRTPISQSEEFFTALKAVKVDARLVRIPDEPHGAGVFHISHRMAREAFLLDWFDRYLAPAGSQPTSQ